MPGLKQYSDDEIYFVLWFKVLGGGTKAETQKAFKHIFGLDLTDTQLRYVVSKYEYDPRFGQVPQSPSLSSAPPYGQAERHGQALTCRSVPRVNNTLIENDFWTERVADWTERLATAIPRFRPARQPSSASVARASMRASGERFPFSNAAVANAFAFADHPASFGSGGSGGSRHGGLSNAGSSVGPGDGGGRAGDDTTHGTNPEAFASNIAQVPNTGANLDPGAIGSCHGVVSFHDLRSIPHTVKALPAGAASSVFDNRSPWSLPPGATYSAVHGWPITPNHGTSRHRDPWSPEETVAVDCTGAGAGVVTGTNHEVDSIWEFQLTQGVGHELGEPGAQQAITVNAGQDASANLNFAEFLANPLPQPVGVQDYDEHDGRSAAGPFMGYDYVYGHDGLFIGGEDGFDFGFDFDAAALGASQARGRDESGLDDDEGREESLGKRPRGE